MFIGEFHFNIDDKGRLFLPSELRKGLGEEVIVARGIEKCLYVYPTEAWKTMVDKISNLSFTKKNNREFSRLFLSGAYQREIDTKGRINLDSILIEYSGLKKDCVILGVGQRLEIWDKEAWIKYYQDRQSVIDSISEEIELDI